MVEMVPVCNEQNEVIGQLPKDTVHPESGAVPIIPYHRSVQVFLVNSKGEVLLHRKARGKREAGAWNVSASGHVRMKPNGEPETYEEAAKREVHEELGVRVNRLRHIGDVPASEKSAYEFARVFVAVSDAPFMPSREEIHELMFVPVVEVKHMMVGNPFTSVFKALWKYFGTRI